MERNSAQRVIHRWAPKTTPLKKGRYEAQTRKTRRLAFVCGEFSIASSGIGPTTGTEGHRGSETSRSKTDLREIVVRQKLKLMLMVAPTMIGFSSGAYAEDAIKETACTAYTASSVLLALAKDPSISRVQGVMQTSYLADSGPIEIALFKPFTANAFTYRVVVVDDKTVDVLLNRGDASPAPPENSTSAAADTSQTKQKSEQDASSPAAASGTSDSKTARESDVSESKGDENYLLPPLAFSQYVPADALSAEAAASATDFAKAISQEPKTLLHYTSDIKNNPLTNGTAKLYVIGCSVVDAKPAFVSVINAEVSNRALACILAILLCAVSYCAAVAGTYKFRQIWLANKHSSANTSGNSPKGTAYATLRQHFNPVVLTAGSNGRGSPAKLQILFFSLVVLGLVFYLLMLTGHLSGLSNTVLLLMGISGLGSTAAAGAEVTKNRLNYDNWTWLINNQWLPQGGVAEENMAHWQDIVATDGEFDVYRFQMVTFSFLVGMSLLKAGASMTDLSSFDIPEGLLGILGLSQVVYVAGKLVAPPSISDLNDAIKKLRDAERALREKLSAAGSGLLGETVVLMVDNDTVKDVKKAFGDYIDAWDTARTMFESTLGRLVPDQAKKAKPPFPVPHTFISQAGNLPPGRKGDEYNTTITALGGSTPYAWRVIGGALPQGILLDPNSGSLLGTPTQGGVFHFLLEAKDASGKISSDKFTIAIT
ncbi:Ig domain-containing protein [Caballeronia sp. 15711]|uniref:Ig domain-containing protein n=1 Tax=Caballeronia sp. 15711 TaxID=3391029 RepID=UPI0039E69CCB